MMTSNSQQAILDKWYNLYSEESREIIDVDDILLDDLNTPGFIAKIHELSMKPIKAIMKKIAIQSCLQTYWII